MQFINHALDCPIIQSFSQHPTAKTAHRAVVLHMAREDNDHRRSMAQFKRNIVGAMVERSCHTISWVDLVPLDNGMVMSVKPMHVNILNPLSCSLLLSSIAKP